MSTNPAPHWRKSSHSNDNGQCVELACTPGTGFMVGDSKNPTGPVLTFPSGLPTLITTARRGTWL